MNSYYQQYQSEFLETLKAFLRIPSISTLSEHKPDIRRAAEFARSQLAAAGMTVAEFIEGDGNPLVDAERRRAAGSPRSQLAPAGRTVAESIEGDGNPLVYAEWLGAPGKPTLLFYGHY